MKPRTAALSAILSLALLGVPLAADAQQLPKVPRVGYLGGSHSSPLLEPFRQGLRDLSKGGDVGSEALSRK